MIQKSRILAATAAIAFFIGASVLVAAQDAGPRPATGPTSLGSLQSSLRDIAQKVRPAVVEINVTSIITQQAPESDSPFDWFNQQQGNGQRKPRSVSRASSSGPSSSHRS